MKDSEIDAKIKTEISQLTQQVIAGYANNQPEQVWSLTTDGFKNISRETFERNLIEYGFVFREGKYQVMNEFYRKGLKKGIQVNFESGTSDMHDYFVRVIPYGDEVFLSVGYFDGPKNRNSLILVWNKVDGKWLLNYIHAGILRVGDKDLVDWFEEASSDYKTGALCDAGMKLTIVSRMLNKTVLPLFYVQEAKIKAQGREMMQEINKVLAFPYVVTYVSSQPSILRIHPIVEKDTLYPLVQYVSKINIQDSVHLAEECDRLHEKLGEIYPGIERNKKKVCYQVFDRMPETERSLAKYTFTREFK